MTRWMLAPLALLVIAPAQAQTLRFVTCPVYRDTDHGRKSGCWLADDRETGIRYDVTQAPSKPDWNYAILVEGRKAGADAGEPCGAPVLDPVRTSILFDQRCVRHMIPAEGYPGRKFVLPPRAVSPLAAPPKAPAPPYADHTFHLYFDLDRDFIIYQYGDYLLDQMIQWIRVAKPKRIAITGYAAVDAPDASGQKITEDPALAKKRAEKIEHALVLLGVDPDIITTRWSTDPKVIDDPGADGLAQQSRRRVDIAATL